MRISDWSSDVCSSDLFTQELRLSSTANGGPVEWLVGGFFTSEKSTFQSDFQPVHADNSFDNDTTIVYGDDEFTHYKEYALFGNLTYYLTPKLDVTAGARYAHNRTTFISFEKIGRATGRERGCQYV